MTTLTICRLTFAQRVSLIQNSQLINVFHLINVFRAEEINPEFLSAWVSERAYYDRSGESKRTKEAIVSKAGHRREVQREKTAALDAKATLGGAPALALGRLVSRFCGHPSR